MLLMAQPIKTNLSLPTQPRTFAFFLEDVEQEMWLLDSASLTHRCLRSRPWIMLGQHFVKVSRDRGAHVCFNRCMLCISGLLWTFKAWCPRQGPHSFLDSWHFLSELMWAHGCLGLHGNRLPLQERLALRGHGGCPTHLGLPHKTEHIGTGAQGIWGHWAGQASLRGQRW